MPIKLNNNGAGLRNLNFQIKNIYNHFNTNNI